MTVVPGRPETAKTSYVELAADYGAIIVDGLSVGVCATDREIVEHGFGARPAGADRLVLGHESLGRVSSAPGDTGFLAGELVVGIVRRPDPEPCPACRNGEWDACSNGGYLSRGIRGLHGYGAASWRLEPGFAVRLDPTLGRLGVLVEPASVMAKAWEQIERIGRRATRQAERVLVIGAGPIGLLGALMSVQRGHETHVLDRVAGGIKADLVRDLGATYHSDGVGRVPGTARPTIVIECTGTGALIPEVIELAAPNLIVCLVGLGDGGQSAVDLAAVNRLLVRKNGVLFGSINANRRHYEAAAAALAGADRSWLAGLITRRVALSDWSAALVARGDDVKVVVDLDR
jgi:glucose 1-dehydrogenase